MGEEKREAGDENYEPQNEDCPERVGFGTDWNGRDGMNDGQIAVEGHKHQRVDTSICRHYHQVLDDFTPDITEWPEKKSVVGCRERDAQDDEEKIGHRQIDNQQIGCISHLQHFSIRVSVIGFNWNSFTCWLEDTTATTRELPINPMTKTMPKMMGTTMDMMSSRLDFCMSVSLIWTR